MSDAHDRGRRPSRSRLSDGGWASRGALSAGSGAVPLRLVAVSRDVRAGTPPPLEFCAGERLVLVAPSPVLTSPAHRRDATPVPFDDVSDERPILARGPWDPADVRASLEPRSVRAGGEGDGGRRPSLEELRERGSPAHDGLAARLVAFEARRRPSDARAPARAMGAAPARPTTPPRSLLGARAPCAPPTAAGSPAAARLARDLGRALGARRRRRRRGRREPRAHARPGARGGVVGPPRSGSRSRRSSRRPNGMVCSSGQAWLADGAEVVRPTTSTTSSPGGPPRSTAGRSEADTPLRHDGARCSHALKCAFRASSPSGCSR